DKFARAAPPASAPPQASASDEPPQRTITRKSIADARAEWVSQQPRAEPARVERVVATSPAPAVQNNPRAAMPNLRAPPPPPSRWTAAPTPRSLTNPTALRVAAAYPTAAQPAPAEEVQQPAVDQVVP